MVDRFLLLCIIRISGVIYNKLYKTCSANQDNIDIKNLDV